MKMQSTPQFDAYLYNQYFEKPINELCEKYKKGGALSNPKGSTLSNPKGSALSNPKGFTLSNPDGDQVVVGGRDPLVVGGRNPQPQLKKADLIRFQNTHKHIEDHKQTIFEYILLDLLEKFLKYRRSTKVSGGTKANDEWMFYYYTIRCRRSV